MDAETLHNANIEIEERLGNNLSCVNPDGSWRSDERCARAMADCCYAGAAMFRFGEHTLKYSDYLHWLIDEHDTGRDALWRNRHGKPWQADIEAAVASFRAPARDFTGEDGNVGEALNRCFTQLIPIIEKRKWRWMLFGGEGQASCEIVDPVSTHTKGEAHAPTPCAAIALAFLQATRPKSPTSAR